MKLEDRLERLADRTPPGDPADVMDRARGRVRDTATVRTRRPLAVAAVLLVAVALVSGAVALLIADGDAEVEVASGDGDVPAADELEGVWRVVSTIEDGERRPSSGTARLRFFGGVIVGQDLDRDDVVIAEGNDGCDNALYTDVEDNVIAPPEDRTRNACPDADTRREADLFWDGLGRPLELQDGELLLFTEDGDGLVFSQGIGDGPFAAYCADVTELDLTSAFPTDGQWDRLTDHSPPEISADARTVRATVELQTSDSGFGPDEDLSAMEGFWAASFRIEAFQQEHCGVVFPDDLPDEAEREEMGLDDE